MTVNKEPIVAAATTEPGKSINRFPSPPDNRNNNNKNTEGDLDTSSRRASPERKRQRLSPSSTGNASNPKHDDAGSSWTEEEHEQFKMGIIIHGWGNWDKIAKNVPTKSIPDMQSRALDISRHNKEEESRLKDKHIQLVHRSPQLYSSEYVRQVTAVTTSENNAADIPDTDAKESENPNRALGMWTQEEHSQFEQACIQFGWGDWLNVTTQIPTRDKNEVKSHAQEFDIHHLGDRERLEKAHAEALQNAKNTEKSADERNLYGEDKPANDLMDVENGNSTIDKVHGTEAEQFDDEKGEKSTEGEDKETEGDEDGNTSDESRQQQQLRVSPRVVKAPRDNYMDSLQRDQWQRKAKKESPKKSVSGGVRKRHDGSHDVRVWFSGKWRNIGVFENEHLAKVAFRIAGDVLPDTAPTDPAAIDWNIQIARDAAIDGAKLAERDAEGGDGGVGLLEPKAMQNCLLGGHIVSAGEQTIKHRLFLTATAKKAETNLAHFTVTCSNGPIHVDVGINDSLFDLRRKIFDQFDPSQLDDGNCNFNFQVGTNMISRKVEGSFIARDLLQLGKSVELIPRSAVLSGESITDISSENGLKHLKLDEDDDDDDDEDLTSFFEAESAAVSAKVMTLANESAHSQSSNSGKVVDFIKSILTDNIDHSYPELCFVYMMEKTGLHEEEVEQWISDAKNRCAKPVE